MEPQSRRNGKVLQVLVGAIAATLFSTSLPVLAAEKFGNDGIQFDVDTVIEFEFMESHGAYQSTFGVVNLDTGEKTPLIAEAKPSDNPQDVNRPSKYREQSGLQDPTDFLGTPGNAVPEPLAEFLFKANTRYGFYLESVYNGRSAGTVYSNNAQNLGSREQARFEGDISGLKNGGTMILWDDTGSLLVKPQQQDRDFNDFIVRAGGHLTCPYSNGKPQSNRSSKLSGVRC